MKICIRNEGEQKVAETKIKKTDPSISIKFPRGNSMLNMEDFIENELKKAKLLATQTNKSLDDVSDAIKKPTKIMDKKTKLRKT